jgi:hypothetical protein
VPSIASDAGKPEFSVLDAVAEEMLSWLLVQIAWVTSPSCVPIKPSPLFTGSSFAQPATAAIVKTSAVLLRIHPKTVDTKNESQLTNARMQRSLRREIQ